MKSEKCSKKQVDTLITSEKAKTFILNNIVFTKDRNIKEQIGSVRNLGIVGLLMGMIFFYFIHAQGLSEGISTMFFAIYFYAIILLSILSGFWAIQRSKKAIIMNKIFDEKKVLKRKESYWQGGLGGLIGYIFIGPRLNLIENGIAFGVIALSSFFILLSAFSISHAQYNLYLLKKYCPEIANLKADDLIPKKTIIPKNKKKK